MGVKSFVQSQYVPSTKAIPNVAALRDGNSVPAYSDASKRVRTPFSQREAARHLEAYGGQDDAIDWVMDCVRLITETASSADWHFEKEGVRYYTEKSPDVPDDAEEAPLMLSKLFDEPNPHQSLEELIELTLIDYLLVGNAYWMKWRTNDAGQPLALYRLAPPHVKVVPGPFGIERYTYEIPGHDKLELDPSQVMHFRQPNPHSPYYGLGIIQGGSRVFDMDLALTETMTGYYEKRAQPSMVVQSDRRVPKDVFKRLQNQLRAMYGGPRNAGALMVLEAGLKYQSISPSAVDAGFESLTGLSRDRIFAMFRVPASLLGYSGGANDSTTAGSQDQRIFDTKTMRPLLNKFQNAVTKGVSQFWEMEFKIDYDYIMPVEERLRLTSTFAAIPGVRVREVREYAGLPPLGDPLLDEIVLNMPGENVEEGGHPEIADNNLAGEQGRPPNPENTSAFPANGRIPAGAAARRTSLAAADNKAMTSAEILAEIDRLRSKPLDTKAVKVPKDELAEDRDSAVDAVVDDLKADIIEAIHVLERGLLDEVKGSYEGKAPGDRLRSKLRGSAAWTTWSESFTAALEKAARRGLSAATLHQARKKRDATDDVDFDALAREVVYRTGGARKISANLKSEVAQKVGKALREGSTRQEVELAVRQAMDFWRESHAETVALTEAVHAYNEGTITVAELTGATHVAVHDGDDHDEPCREADGQIWTIEKARDNRLEHPRCRRGFTPMPNPEVA